MEAASAEQRDAKDEESGTKPLPSMVRNTGICDNIVYQGIPTTVRLVMDGRSRMKPTLTDMIGGKVNRTIGSQF